MDTQTSNGHRITEFGEAALTGWRGAAGRAIAKPIARRTRFSQQQVEAAIGIALVAVRDLPRGAAGDPDGAPLRRRAA